MRRALLAVSLAALAMGPTAARAQNSALAEGLFREGKKLLEQRRFDEACPKFKEAARLDLSSGVELALGICFEGQGRLASAWGAYLSAASLAHHDRRSDREDVAKARAMALEPKLSHATINVAIATAGLPGLVVRQDDVVLESPAWANVPVDIGTHRIDATAPGKKPFSRVYIVSANGDSLTVGVPELEDVPAPLPAPALAAPLTQAAPTPPPPPRGTIRTVGFVTGGAGLGALVAGSVFGAVTLSDAAAVHRVCPSNTTKCASASIRSENSTAETLADVSTTLFIVGGVALATGALLVLANPHGAEDSRPAAWIRPVVSPSFSGLVGQW
jgi:hypothetical protein